MLKPNNQLIKRTITGSIFAGSIIATLYVLPPIYFSFIVLLMLTIILINEWPLLAKKNSSLWLLAPLYPIAPFTLLIYMNHIPESRTLLSLLFMAAFCNDTGAYITGKLLGSHPLLLAAISPNKTWEGFVGGLLSVILCLFIFQYFNPNSLLENLTLVQIFLFGTIISIIATAGDLFESFLKRLVQIKDSGTFLPGHGGLLDRLDSILFLVILFYFIQ